MFRARIFWGFHLAMSVVNESLKKEVCSCGVCFANSYVAIDWFRLPKACRRTRLFRLHTRLTPFAPVVLGFTCVPTSLMLSSVLQRLVLHKPFRTALLLPHKKMAELYKSAAHNFPINLYPISLSIYLKFI